MLFFPRPSLSPVVEREKILPINDLISLCKNKGSAECNYQVSDESLLDSRLSIWAQGAKTIRLTLNVVFSGVRGIILGCDDLCGMGLWKMVQMGRAFISPWTRLAQIYSEETKGIGPSIIYRQVRPRCASAKLGQDTPLFDRRTLFSANI